MIKGKIYFERIIHIMQEYLFFTSRYCIEPQHKGSIRLVLMTH